MAKVRGIIRQHRTKKQEDLINTLNPVIRGWANNQRYNVSSVAFKYVDFQIWKALWRWALRRHKNKGKKWIAKSNCPTVGTCTWTFSVLSKKKTPRGSLLHSTLVYACDTKIARFRRIKTIANPFDRQFQVYFEEREINRMKVSLKGRKTLFWLFNQQKGHCPKCSERMTTDTGCKVHFIKENSQKMLVHPNCHKQIHSLIPVQSVLCGSVRF